MTTFEEKRILASVDAILSRLTGFHQQEARRDPALAAGDNQLFLTFSALLPLLLPLVENQPELLWQMVQQLFLQRLAQPAAEKEAADAETVGFCLNAIQLLFARHTLALRGCPAEADSAPFFDPLKGESSFLPESHPPDAGFPDSLTADIISANALSTDSLSPEVLASDSTFPDALSSAPLSTESPSNALSSDPLSPAALSADSFSSGSLAPADPAPGETAAGTHLPFPPPAPEPPQKRLARLLAWVFPGETLLTEWSFRGCSFDAYLPRLRLALRLGEEPKTCCRDSLWLKKEKIRLVWIPETLLADPRAFRRRLRPSLPSPVR